MSEVRSEVSAGWVAAILFFLTLIVFAPAIRNGFVNYDDNGYVTANPQVKRGLTLEGIRWAATAQVSSNWHPLTLWSHMLDVSLFGMNPAGHHATSVLLHALNAALAFLVLRRLTNRLWLSALTALVFALHPLRVESVGWVAERKDVLSGLFFFGTLWAYACYVDCRTRKQPAWRWYLAALATFALGLTAKPMLVTVPGVLLLLDFWPLRRWRTAEAGWLTLEKLAFIALSAASSWVTYAVQKQSGAVTAALSVGERVENAMVSLVRYIGKIVWPNDLAVLYLHPGDWRPALVIGAGMVVATISFVAILQWRRRPWLTVGWLWFVGMLVPVIGLVQVGLQAMADRYTYLPAIGLEIAMIWTVAEFIGSPARRSNLATGVVLLAGAMGVGAVAQLRVWRDSITLFTHTIAVAGEGNYLAYDNRGIAWQEKGDVVRAVADYEQALAIRPEYPNSNNNLGRVLAERGQFDAAIAHYRTALRGAPENLEIHNNLANALSDAGRITEAVAEYRYVLSRDPNHLDARNGYAVALATMGRLTEAETEFKRMLALAPDDVSTLANLGNVCAIQGRRGEAEPYYERALQLRPDDPKTLYNLGLALSEDGRLADAVGKLSRAVALAPVNPEAHARLGLVLGQLGQRAEAIRELKLAIAQRPNFTQAEQWLTAVQGNNR